MEKRYDLAIDSDGVVADFDKKIVELFDGQPLSSKPKGYLWQCVTHYDKHVQPFFESLEEIGDAHALIEFAYANFRNVFILTAAGYTPTDGAEQKRRWYAKRYPGLRVEVVKKSADKAAFATPRTILVDDRPHSIDPWVAAGGIGVMHTSAASSIAQLRAIIES
jgi:5'(3')-deoxyribonucleotidase